MRPLVAITLAACTTSEPALPCPTRLFSEVVHEAGAISSGKTAIGVVWSRDYANNLPEFHAVRIEADGTIGPEIRVGALQQRAIVGSSTIAWLSEGPPFAATLARGGDVTPVDLDPSARTRTVVFDGEHYQVFFATPDGVYHHALSEAGELGPAHELLAPPPQSLFSIGAVSDGAGTTFVQIRDKGYFIDTTSGTLTQVYVDDAAEPNSAAFYFAGRFHVRRQFPPRLVSITPSGGTEERSLVGDVLAAREFLPAETRLYARTETRLIEIDENFLLVRDIPAPFGRSFAILGPDLVHLERHDAVAPESGHVDVVREGAWQVELAHDSALVDMCEGLP